MPTAFHHPKPRDVPWDYWRNLFSGLQPPNATIDAEGVLSWSSADIFEEVHRDGANSLNQVSSIEWCQKPEWSAFEATAVSFGKDPTQLHAKPELLDSNFGIFFADRTRLIEGAQTSGQLAAKIAPMEFLAWATREHVSYPTQLDEAVSAIREGLANLTARCKDLESKNQKLLQKVQEQELEVSKLRNIAPAQLGSRDKKTAHALRHHR